DAAVHAKIIDHGNFKVIVSSRQKIKGNILSRGRERNRGCSAIVNFNRDPCTHIIKCPPKFLFERSFSISNSVCYSSSSISCTSWGNHRSDFNWYIYQVIDVDTTLSDTPGTFVIPYIEDIGSSGNQVFPYIHSISWIDRSTIW